MGSDWQEVRTGSGNDIAPVMTQFTDTYVRHQASLD